MKMSRMYSCKIITYIILAVRFISLFSFQFWFGPSDLVTTLYIDLQVYLVKFVLRLQSLVHFVVCPRGPVIVTHSPVRLQECEG